jgi:hypothetical protein
MTTHAENVRVAINKLSSQTMLKENAVRGRPIIKHQFQVAAKILQAMEKLYVSIAIKKPTLMVAVKCRYMEGEALISVFATIFKF